MCHIKPHNLMGEMSRSRSSFKVKGQIEGQKHATLTLIITFYLLQIANSYLAYVFISLRRTFWWVTCQGQGHTSRSNWRSKTCNFNIGHNFSPIADSNLIFGMWIHLTKTHNLMGDMSRSRSYFKVKGQVEVKKRATLTMAITFHLLQIATWYLACGFISLRRTILWVTCQGQGHSSGSKVKLKLSLVPTGGHSVSQTHLVLFAITSFLLMLLLWNFMDLKVTLFVDTDLRKCTSKYIYRKICEQEHILFSTNLKI